MTKKEFGWGEGKKRKLDQSDFDSFVSEEGGASNIRCFLGCVSPW